MKLTIKIDLDNAAFEHPGEIKNVLEQVGTKIAGSTNGDSGSIRDSNGNTVGSWEVK